MNTPTVSKAEIEFQSLWRKANKYSLMPSDDWFDPKTEILYEIKDVKYPYSHFPKEFRMNAVSMQMHKMRAKRVIVAVKFTDGWWYADAEDIRKNSRYDYENHFGDRDSLFVPISILKVFEFGKIL